MRMETLTYGCEERKKERNGGRVKKEVRIVKELGLREMKETYIGWKRRRRRRGEAMCWIKGGG